MPAVRLLLFAGAREAAGRRDDEFDAAVLGELLGLARARYGPDFAAVLDGSRVWINGDEAVAGLASPLSEGDEVAVLPPVSGGDHDRPCDSLECSPFTGPGLSL
jgi:MoaD family protein